MESHAKWEVGLLRRMAGVVSAVCLPFVLLEEESQEQCACIERPFETHICSGGRVWRSGTGTVWLLW